MQWKPLSGERLPQVCPSVKPPAWDVPYDKCTIPTGGVVCVSQQTHRPKPSSGSCLFFPFKIDLLYVYDHAALDTPEEGTDLIPEGCEPPYAFWELNS